MNLLRQNFRSLAASYYLLLTTYHLCGSVIFLPQSSPKVFTKPFEELSQPQGESVTPGTSHFHVPRTTPHGLLVILNDSKASAGKDKIYPLYSPHYVKQFHRFYGWPKLDIQIKPLFFSFNSGLRQRVEPEL